MKQKITLIAILTAALCGCVSEELTWGGNKAVRNADGTVLVNPTTGAPYYEKEQNHLERFSHLNDVEMKELHVKADGDSYEAHLGQLGSWTGSNTVGVIDASLSGATKLVTECGILYTKVAGGATVAVATEAAEKLVAAFQASGGNTSTATVSVTDGKLSITDGTTTSKIDSTGTVTTHSVETEQATK